MYVRTILNGVGQLSCTWVGTICERETEIYSIRVQKDINKKKTWSE